VCAAVEGVRALAASSKRQLAGCTHDISISAKSGTTVPLSFAWPVDPGAQKLQVSGTSHIERDLCDIDLSTLDNA